MDIKTILELSFFLIGFGLGIKLYLSFKESSNVLELLRKREDYVKQVEKFKSEDEAIKQIQKQKEMDYEQAKKTFYDQYGKYLPKSDGEGSGGSDGSK